MPIYHQGRKIKDVYYQGRKVKEIWHMGRKVYSVAPDYPEWSESGSYQVGDIVSYRGGYYQLKRRQYQSIPPDYPLLGSRIWQEVFPW